MKVKEYPRTGGAARPGEAGRRAAGGTERFTFCKGKTRDGGTSRQRARPARDIGAFDVGSESAHPKNAKMPEAEQRIFPPGITPLRFRQFLNGLAPGLCT